jgi:hypothetical protein
MSFKVYSQEVKWRRNLTIAGHSGGQINSQSATYTGICNATKGHKTNIWGAPLVDCQLSHGHLHGHGHGHGNGHEHKHQNAT